MQQQSTLINFKDFVQDLIFYHANKMSDQINISFNEENKLPATFDINSNKFRVVLDNLIDLASLLSKDETIEINTSYYGYILRVDINFILSPDIRTSELDNIKSDTFQFPVISKMINEMGSKLIVASKENNCCYFRFYLKNNFPD